MIPIIEERDASLAHAEVTLAAGAALAPAMTGGMVVTLSGELGAGKTTLVRGALRRLGWAGPVKSPTYTLVEHYAFSSLYFYHFDFYRFNDPTEWESTGFSEYFQPTAVCLIEWPERVAMRLPVVDLALALTVQGSGRSLHLAARTAAGKACLAAYAATSS
ncbi:MAG: tRNA (adenosine(37)-N6)-threonylcarbamoyltransferase complex ATPase subunit type 1 TsaE [Casimicrobiaceae bacterium]